MDMQVYLLLFVNNSTTHFEKIENLEKLVIIFLKVVAF
jgi:hypothetical protein